MITLKQLIENSKYNKVKALYDNPGTPGEKQAAKAAMDRMKPQKQFDPDDIGLEDHDEVLSHHGFTTNDNKNYTHPNGMSVTVNGDGEDKTWKLTSKKHHAMGWFADTLHDHIEKAKSFN